MLHWFDRQPNRKYIVTFVVTVLAGISIELLFNRPWLYLLLVPPLLLGFHYYNKLSTIFRAIWIGLMIAIIIVFVFNDIKIIRSNINQPPEWDFLTFWLDGQVFSHQLNFYDPANYQQLASSLNLASTPDFIQEITNVGFRYPPPTMFLFAPLGWFPLQTAYGLWYLVSVAAFAVDVILLWKIFLSERRWIGLGLTTALILMLHATSLTLSYGQTNLILLLMLLLYWQNRERTVGGMWLALGIVIKPILGFFVIYLVLRRNWRVMIATGATLLGMVALAAILFGPSVFANYISSNPDSHLPGYVYTEIVNQSLLATILRVTGFNFNGQSPLMDPIFIVVGLLLLSITSWFIFRVKGSNTDRLLALMLTLALMLYPATLVHYSLMLILPLFVIWAARDKFVGGIWSIVALITIEFLLMANTSMVFVAITFAWLVMFGIVIGVLLISDEQTQPVPLDTGL